MSPQSSTDDQLAKQIGMVAALLECARFVLEETEKMAQLKGASGFVGDISAAKAAMDKACLKMEVVKGLQSQSYKAILHGEQSIKASLPFGNSAPP